MHKHSHAHVGALTGDNGPMWQVMSLRRYLYHLLRLARRDWNISVMVHAIMGLDAVSSFASFALGGHHTDVIKLASFNRKTLIDRFLHIWALRKWILSDLSCSIN